MNVEGVIQRLKKLESLNTRQQVIFVDCLKNGRLVVIHNGQQKEFNTKSTALSYIKSRSENSIVIIDDMVKD